MLVAHPFGCGVTSLVSRDAFRHDRRREFSSAPLAGVKPIRDFAAYISVVIRGAALPRLNADDAMDSTARFGSDHGALRSEDEPLLTGGGAFTDDLNVPGRRTACSCARRSAMRRSARSTARRHARCPA
jgi:hypothetical protein